MLTRRAVPVCVYTHDWRDEADVRRILTALRHLGVRGSLYYKTDAQTRAGLRGHVWSSPSGSEMQGNTTPDT